MQNIWKYTMIMSIIAAACNNEQKKDQQSKQDSIVKPNTLMASDSMISGCYSLIANRDTASFQVQIKEALVTGSLSYNLFEKDRNDGIFEGAIRNDLLTGWYFFRSEGIISVRQVAWKIGHGYLWPATAEVMVRNDTAMFVNPDKLSFDSSRTFVKVECVI
jgi:hypothetical protein